MEFSVGGWRSEAEGVFVAQNFGDAAVNGDEFLVLGGEKGLTATGIGERLECRLAALKLRPGGVAAFESGSPRKPLPETNAANRRERPGKS